MTTEEKKYYNLGIYIVGVITSYDEPDVRWTTDDCIDVFNDLDKKVRELFPERFRKTK